MTRTKPKLEYLIFILIQTEIGFGFALLYKPGDCLQSQAGRFKKVRTEKTQSHFTMVSFFFFFFSHCFVSLPVAVFDSGPPILQADFTEELEPLFDYSRVQPLNVISLLDDGELFLDCISPNSIQA